MKMQEHDPRLGKRARMDLTLANASEKELRGQKEKGELLYPRISHYIAPILAVSYLSPLQCVVAE